MGRMLGAFDNPQELDRPDLNKCPDCECYFAQDNCPLCGKECPEEMRAGNRKKPKKAKRVDPYANRVRFIAWYHSWWFIIIMTVINPLIGVILLFTSPHATKHKVIFVVVCVALVLVVAIVIPLIIHAVMSIQMKLLFNTISGESNYPDLSREEYVELCTPVTPQKLYTEGENYERQPVAVKLVVTESVVNEKGMRILYCEAEYGPSLSFVVRDCSDNSIGNVTVGDVIMVYGEFYSSNTVTINGVRINMINMFYFKLLSRGSLCLQQKCA